MTPQQLLLDIHRQAPPTFANFVTGSNRELVERVKAIAQPQSLDAVYLWGPPGCGRSHLLAATAAAADRPTCLLAAKAVGPVLDLAPGTLLLVDDVDQLDADAQITLFRTYNAARLGGYGLLFAGPVPPAELALREDLRTRFGLCLIYELKPLTDEEKAAALRHLAAGRGMRLDDGIITYLLRHGRRDLPALMATVEALDRASLELKRPATLPLLREILQLPLETS